MHTVSPMKRRVRLVVGGIRRSTQVKGTTPRSIRPMCFEREMNSKHTFILADTLRIAVVAMSMSFGALGIRLVPIFTNCTSQAGSINKRAQFSFKWISTIPVSRSSHRQLLLLNYSRAAVSFPVHGSNQWISMVCSCFLHALILVVLRLAFQSIFQIVCAIIYLTFITYFLAMEIHSLIRLKKAYFFQFWPYIELGVIVCSWTSVGIHFLRRVESTRILKVFRQTNGDVYVNFQLMAYINDLFTFLIAFCCFFGTLKLLRLCRYNRRLALLANTLKRASPELLSFSCMFSIIFMAFMALFYLQFVSQVWECATLLHTAQMLFEMLLLKFDTTEFVRAQPLLGPIYFALFILFIVFVCINMFVSIINDNFRVVRDDVHKVDDDDQDLFITTLTKLQRWWCKTKFFSEIEDDLLSVHFQRMARSNGLLPWRSFNDLTSFRWLKWSILWDAWLRNSINWTASSIE